jgi:hypothetical protein
MRTLTAVVCAMLVAGAAAAQDQQPAQDQKGAQAKQMDARKRMLAETLKANARVPLERTTAGAPYSAETVVEINQMLADGNRITRRTTGRVYRDSQGRVRREEDRANGAAAMTIVDPVAGVSYRLDPDDRVAWKTPADVSRLLMKKMAEAKQIHALGEGTGHEAADAGALPPPPPPPPPAEFEGRTLPREAHQTSVERKTIEGVAVQCTDAKTVLPAGFVGNELPLTITSENCSSPDLNVLVMTRHADPRTGETTYRLTNIVRAEPDPSLFVVPPGYTIKDTEIRRPEPRREP